MEGKVYKVKGGNRLVAVLIGLAFALAGILLVVTQNNWLGALLALIGLIAIWAGVRPNKLIFTADALVDQTLTARRFPYSSISRVRMVARRFLHGSKTSVGTRMGGVNVRMATSGLRYRMYPEIQIEGDFPAPLILEMAYAGQLIDEAGKPIEGITYRFRRGSRYDTQAVLRDLLDRLPSNVQIDSAAQAYAATGSVPDVTSLPQENPRLPFGGQSQ